MVAMVIRDEQLVRDIEELASRLGMSPEEVVGTAVMEATQRLEDDKRDRLARIEERWKAIRTEDRHASMMEIDDLMYDDDGLPQ
jgi:hypothetical protein